MRLSPVGMLEPSFRVKSTMVLFNVTMPLDRAYLDEIATTHPRMRFIKTPTPNPMNRPITKPITSVLWIVPLLGILLGLSACAGKTTPPGANMILANFTEPEGFAGSCTLLQWQEGLSIAIVPGGSKP
jgi:hypothetical protein